MDLDITKAALEIPTDIERAYHLMKQEYDILEKRGWYNKQSLDGYRDALNDLRMIIKQEFNLDIKDTDL